MYLIVLKGFDLKEVKEFEDKFLIKEDPYKKLNLNFANDFGKKFIRALTTMDEDKYILFEELVYASIDDNSENIQRMLDTFEIKLKIVYNNIYPELYPCHYNDYKVLNKFIDYINEDSKEPIGELLLMSKIYNKVSFINEHYYVMYNNIEYDFGEFERENMFPETPKDINESLMPDFIYEINEDSDLYISKLNDIIDNNYKNIGIRLMGDNNSIKELYKSFLAFLNTGDYNLCLYEKFENRKDLTDDFYSIVKNIIKIPDFVSFKDLDFYENPTLSNKITKINQTQIMADMVEQVIEAKKCEQLIMESDGKNMSGYRDMFVTAPTGAGKSLMFQIPAIYLANKFNYLTIIITPLIELMNDQVRNLHERGYYAAERLNSSINAIEKQNIVKKIDKGEINLLYLAPETLLSYSIDQLIGSRNIGLVIIDEAHIVSTWGKGFRPDYWYLGTYLDKLRKFRNYRGMKEKDKKIYCFPICTFTATAVFGGRFDDVNDIKNSLYLRDTITYLGNVKRDNIKFEINDHSKEKTQNKDEYTTIKNETFRKVISKFIASRKKSIVYFPYASYAKSAYYGDDYYGFGLLKDYRDNFAIYIGGDNFSSEEKGENMLQFRDGEKNIMFATKAFGMGIDIKDIENVYHYAASGNLNDYVQEVGRVARSKDIPYGIASTDYYDRDLSFMKTLYGMSALHNWEVLKILSIIMNLYNSKKKRNMLVTPDMFKTVFGKVTDDQLENKIKSALLTIEKDLAYRYRGSKPLVTRPRNMFSECFAMVKREDEEALMASEYGKYFKKIAKGRNKEQDLKSYSQVLVTDMGDIFTIDLKGLWEDMFSKMSFGEFKYTLFNAPYEIFNKFYFSISLRNKITIKSVDDSSLKELKEKIIAEIDTVSEVLNEYQIEGCFFNKEDLAKKLDMKYHNKFKAHTVANTYIETIADYKDEYTQSFYERREINGEQKYMITRGNYRSIAEKVIYSSSFMKNLKYMDSSEFTTFDSHKKIGTGIKRDDRYDALNLALLFGLISFEIIGGNKPEIFIRVNYPDKINQIVNGNVKYYNSLVEEARERHHYDVTILNYFFTQLDSNEDRWNFIENYYLGNVCADPLGNVTVDEFEK